MIMISSGFKLLKIFSELCIRLVPVLGGRSPFHTIWLTLQSPDNVGALEDFCSL